MKTLKECETAEEYRKYAIAKEDLTDEDRQLCLDKQVTSSTCLSEEEKEEHPDHTERQRYWLKLSKNITARHVYWFARCVPNLTHDQIQQCLDKMVTPFSNRLFLKYVTNLNNRQILQGLYKQVTLKDYNLSLANIPNLTEEHKQYCKDKIKELS